ncbi:hypothetical protein [Nocardiopsis oceani]
MPAYGDHDAWFKEARVYLQSADILIDWPHGLGLKWSLDLCDQLLFGEVPHEPPRMLTMRFRSRYPSADADDVDMGMVVVRIGLRDEHDVHTAEALFRELVGRCPWLRPRPRQEQSHAGPTGPEAAEHPHRTPPEAAEHLQQEEPARASGAGDPGRRSTGPRQQEDHRVALFPPHPAAPGAAVEREWAGFAPGLRTKELYQDVYRRRAEADHR